MIIFWTFCAILILPCLKGQSDSYGLDLNDILNENLMPATFFTSDEIPFLGNSSKIQRNEFYGSSNGGNNFSSAFSTMKYHRKMMNEYKASGFLTKQIFSELAITPSHTLEKRLGKASNESSSDNDNEQNHRTENLGNKDKMLFDEGSSGYTNWLEKTTTLEDIHRQLLESKSKKPKNRKQKSSRRKNFLASALIRRQGLEDEDFADEEDYDEGDITGYAINEPIINPYQEMAFESSRSHPQMVGIIPTTISKVGYNYQPTGHENYDDYGVQQNEPQTKELSLKDIMEIALTTLAFLSFGMFILQVLMCITMNKEDNSMMMMMPMEETTTTMDGTEEIRRKKRSPESVRLRKINELSRRVLISIETVMRINEDDGKCYYRYLCENNKFARNQKDGQKIWIPIWSLGISWLSNRMDAAKTQTNSVLNSLRACAVGLGGGDCESIYSDCNHYNYNVAM